MTKLVGVLSNEALLTTIRVGVIDRQGRLMWEGIGTAVLGKSIVGMVVPKLVTVIEMLVNSVSEALIVGVVAVMPGDIINGVVMATASEVVVGKVGIAVTLGVVIFDHFVLSLKPYSKQLLPHKLFP